MEQIQEVLPTEIETVEPQVEEAVQDAEEGEAPTKTVKNFWERLDEVFNLSKQTNQNLEEILEQFPTEQRINQTYRSALFQPERIALCSNDEQQPSTDLPFAVIKTKATSAVEGHYPSEYFSGFRIRMTRPMRNVKSIQLLSAVLPNATTNLPDSQTFFWYYRLRSVQNANLGAWSAVTQYYPGDIVSSGGNDFVAIVENLNIQPIGVNINTVWKQITLPVDDTRPNYYDLNPHNLFYVYLIPTYFPTRDFNTNDNFYNRSFQDYQDLVNSLNALCVLPFGNNNDPNGNNITFAYNPLLNKIQLVPTDATLNSGDYILPCGYQDSNIDAFMSTSNVDTADVAHYTIYVGDQALGNAFAPDEIAYTPESTLNVRLGFTWNGLFVNPFVSASNIWNDTDFLVSLYWYLCGTDPALTAQNYQENVSDKITFNNYPDLVNTSCVRFYADFPLGSTQDSLGSQLPSGTPLQQGLLSIVPINTTNLGVVFYQNNFDNPLTKIPPNITEINISMLTDQGLPFYLPNSATVLLELAMEYH